MNAIFTIIFLSFSLFASAQKYEKAIIIDLNFIRKSGNNLHADNFPFYFHHPEFAADIQNEISKLVKERFIVKDVLFFNADSIYYIESSITPKTEAKDYAVATKREKTIYISIETILKEQAFINGEMLYRFSTRINVFDNKGKNIYKFKNHIPFVTVYGDEISGMVDMSEQDFYSFYFDGLEYAFEGKYKTVTKRYVSKPSTEKYSEFINSSEKFYLITERNAYSYGQDIDKLSEIVSFTVNYWENANNTFDFMNLVTLDFLDNGYNFINKLDKAEYTVKLKGGVQTLKRKFNPLADIDFQLLDANNAHLAYYTYEGDDLLYGKYRGADFSLKWKSEYSCIEVYIDKKEMAVINYFTDRKVLFLSKEISRKQLVALINTLFILDYSVAIRKKMYAVYN